MEFDYSFTGDIFKKVHVVDDFEVYKEQANELLTNLAKNSIIRPKGEIYQVVSITTKGGYDLSKFSGYSYSWDSASGDLAKNESIGTVSGASLDNVFSILPGKRTLLGPGDMVEVCFYDSNRQRPYIKRLLKRGYYQKDIPNYEGTLLWSQSEGWPWLPGGPRALQSKPSLAGYPISLATAGYYSDRSKIKWSGLTYDNGTIDWLTTVYSGADAVGLKLIHKPDSLIPQEIELPFLHPFVADSGTGPNYLGGWQNHSYGFLYLDNEGFYSIVTPEGVRFISNGELLPRTLNFTPTLERPTQEMNVSVSGTFILQGSWPSLQTVGGGYQGGSPESAGAAQPYFPLNTYLYGWQTSSTGAILHNWSISMNSLCGAIPNPQNIIACGIPERHLSGYLPMKHFIQNARWPMNRINDCWLVGVVADSWPADTFGASGFGSIQNQGPADDLTVYNLEKGMPDAGLVWNLISGIDGTLKKSYTILGNKKELWHRPNLLAEQQKYLIDTSAEDYDTRFKVLTEGSMTEYKKVITRYNGRDVSNPGPPPTAGEGRWKLEFNGLGKTYDNQAIEYTPTWHPLTVYGEDLGGTYMDTYVPGDMVAFRLLDEEFPLFLSNQASAWAALQEAWPNAGFVSYRVRKWALPPPPPEAIVYCLATVELKRNFTYIGSIAKLTYDNTYRPKEKIPGRPFNAPSFDYAPKANGREDYTIDPPYAYWEDPEIYKRRMVPGGRITEDGVIYTIHCIPRWIGTWMIPTEAENTFPTGEYIPVTNAAKVEWSAWNYRIKAEDIDWDLGSGYSYFQLDGSYNSEGMEKFPRRYNHGHAILEKKVSNLHLVCKNTVYETWIKVFDKDLNTLWEKDISQKYIYDPDETGTNPEQNHTATNLNPLHCQQYQVYDYQIVGAKLFILLNRFYENPDGSILTTVGQKEKPFLEVYDILSKNLIKRIDLRQGFLTEIYEFPAMRCGLDVDRNEWAYVVTPEGPKETATPKCRRNIVSFTKNSSTPEVTTEVGNMYINTSWPTCINIHNSMLVDGKVYWIDEGFNLKSSV